MGERLYGQWDVIAHGHGHLSSESRCYTSYKPELFSGQEAPSSAGLAERCVTFNSIFNL